MRSLKSGAVNPVIDPMHSPSVLGKAFPELIRSKITDSDDGAGRRENFGEPDLEIGRNKNIVGVNSKTVIDPKEFPDPEHGSGGHAREMSMDMPDAAFLEPRSYVSRLMET